MEINYQSECLVEKKQRLLNALYELRDNYSSEIPETIIHSTDIDNKYKIRMAWFGMVSLRFDALFRSNLIPEYLIEKRDKVIKEINSRLIKNRGLTSRLDICDADELLTEAITFLESTPKPL